MKKWHMNFRTAGVAALVTAAVGLTGCSGVSTQAAAQPVQSVQPMAQEHLITVTGEETVKVVPDMAQISYGIHTQEADAKTCQAKNAEDLSRAIETLKGLGLAETSIQTSNYGMSPVYNWDSGRQEITGYEMETTIIVSDIPIDQAGQILTASVDAGVNQVNSVSYFSSSYDENYQEALKGAVDMAKAKAETLAQAGGHTLGAVVSVREEGYQPQVRYEGAMTSGYAAAAVEDSLSMDVMPGEIAVEARVEVDFLIAE